ncbi:Peptidase family S58 [Vibrio aerogenes CECT 7868]|uniref:Peptidase family S58 n=1 Tax=Vibrio aerogenes CECT 7868 TaxID=1216006 RepID=A0A1M5Z4B5_9VIBR|nr:P1 family peptidase [Vibrio aerogenes]SHI19021.1 Peptidase family S58 [Vibrio aerogenes CECT 7868]
MNSLQQRIQLVINRWKEEGTIGYRFFPSGNNNSISDVGGVTVGHSTLDSGECQTGVTVIQPVQDNIYQSPVPCGCAVLNGFAKPVGLVQIEELGVLETPIVLTNTLCVGRAFSGTVQYMIEQNPDIGRSLPTVNPLVLECNDGYLNDIQALAVSENLVIDTLRNTGVKFERGSVGAGRGMSCFALKGGIGTSSCYVSELNATVGVLVLANFGALSALRLEGLPFGDIIETHLKTDSEQEDKGSIIILMATDASLDGRQLKRIAKRAGAGLGRLGSYWGHGSGDIAVAFSTSGEDKKLRDSELELLLRAAAEGTETAVLDALLQATQVTGFQDHTRYALSDILQDLYEHNGVN